MIQEPVNPQVTYPKTPVPMLYSTMMYAHNLHTSPVPIFLPSFIFRAHLLSSNSFHTFCILSLFSLAASRFCRVRSSRRPRRHMFTLYLASVQFPVTFQRKPRAWHSSRAATTSAQPVVVSRGCGCGKWWVGWRRRGALFWTSSVWRWGCILSVCDWAGWVEEDVESCARVACVFGGVHFDCWRWSTNQEVTRFRDLLPR
jgi:hypothetical protein